jgi:hypothetical protein
VRFRGVGGEDGLQSELIASCRDELVTEVLVEDVEGELGETTLRAGAQDCVTLGNVSFLSYTDSTTDGYVRPCQSQ